MTVFATKWFMNKYWFQVVRKIHVDSQKSLCWSLSHDCRWLASTAARERKTYILRNFREIFMKNLFGLRLWWWSIVFAIWMSDEKLLALFPTWHCQRSFPVRIFDTLWARFEFVQNLSSGLVEWNYAVVITTRPRRGKVIATQL